jgi:hypothetical protein
LDKINIYLELALSADRNTREGQLIMVRVLQVMGELFQNTIEAPNLSETTIQVFSATLRKSTREIIVGSKALHLAQEQNSKK